MNRNKSSFLYFAIIIVCALGVGAYFVLFANLNKVKTGDIKRIPLYESVSVEDAITLSDFLNFNLEEDIPYYVKILGNVTFKYECPPCKEPALCKPCGYDSIKLQDSTTGQEVVVEFREPAEIYKNIQVGQEIVLPLMYKFVSSNEALDGHFFLYAPNAGREPAVIIQNTPSGAFTKVDYLTAFALALHRNNPSICNSINVEGQEDDYSISYLQLRDRCHVEYAVEKADIDYCLSLRSFEESYGGNITPKDQCLSALASKLKNIELCDLLPIKLNNPSYYTTCVSNVN